VLPFYRKPLFRVRRMVALVLLGAAFVTLALRADATGPTLRATSAEATVSVTPLVDKVRDATSRYLDVNVAVGDGWVPATPCVSGPMSGAMGVHFILPTRLRDGALAASEPEALIYEPQPNGAMRLVGVEFIVLATDWSSLHNDGSVPQVDGHLTNYVGEPNRYGLPAFYELHVWAWEDNPNGSFADWNTRVSCDSQAAP
jgi:hypothetical protein